MGRLLGTTALLLAVGCSGRVETDNRPAFRIDSTQPFRIELGRGSGLHGLDTIRISHDGRVALCRNRRMRDASWESGALQLPAEALAKVVKLVEVNRLMELHRAYYDDAIADGTQWVFWVQQGAREKSVYFNNNFPAQIVRFAEQLDKLLSENGLGTAAWKRVPLDEVRQDQRELWDSIK